MRKIFGGPVGIKTLATSVSEPEDTVEEVRAIFTTVMTAC